MFQVYDSRGRRVVLGREIGRGGEGAVYEIGDTPNLLAKIYEKEVNSEKATKLAAMARMINPALLAISAWPTDILYDRSGGQLRGFLMPRIVGHHEIHVLYSPAQRKLEFPKADWKFLVHVARNLAAAIETVHAQGHVIGDVNQKGILILPQQATVKLIDCDSFQIFTNGRRFLCEVGVKDFTPPELQGKSLRSVERTPNHDNFSLAVICFLLLFMGRHPFAGRFHGAGDDSLERAIREFRFAYSRSAIARKMTPPPNTLPLTIVSPKLATLFECAFGEEAAWKGCRPTAHEWVHALEIFERELRPCAGYPIHKYHVSLTTCPWCEIERVSGSYLFITITTASQTTEITFKLEAVWAQICAMPSPRCATMPNFSPSITPVPLPRKVQVAHFIKRAKIVGAIVLSGFMLTGLTQFGGIIIIGIILLLSWAFCSEINDGGEGNRRRRALHQANLQWEVIQRKWGEVASEEIFLRKFRELNQKRVEYQGLATAYQQDRLKLEANRHAAQLKRFLERHFIHQAKIKGIGPELKSQCQ